MGAGAGGKGGRLSSLPLAQPWRSLCPRQQQTLSRLIAQAAGGKADAERAGGELSRTPAGRVLERELVPELIRRAPEDRSLAEGLQRREAPAGSGFYHFESRLSPNLVVKSGVARRRDFLKKAAHLGRRTELRDRVEALECRRKSI